MTRIALVANERSGSGLGPVELGALLEGLGAEVEWFSLREREAAPSARPDRLAVAGGDGTVGCVAGVAASSKLPLAVIPTGTANDFARATGIPLDVPAACRLAVDGTHVREMELAHMEDRPFVNVASAGLATVAARSALAWKHRLGSLAYLAGAFQAGVTARPIPCTVTCDGSQLYSGLAWQVTVASTGAFGAGARIEVAHPADGHLDVTVIEGGSRLRLVQRAYGMRGGRIVSQRGVHHARGSAVEVVAPPSTPFNVDGEIVPQGPASFSVEPAAFRLVTTGAPPPSA